MRIPLIDNIPILGPLINNVVDGTTPIGVKDGNPPQQPAGVETKVAVSTVATSIASVVLSLLAPVINKWPAPIRMLANLFLPALVSAIAGYFAPHTARVDAPKS
jgi:hypothetical protein